jgi:hypothetical protein
MLHCLLFSKAKNPAFGRVFPEMYLLVTTYMATQPGYVTRDRRRGRKPLFTRDKVMALNVSNIAG